MRIERYCYKVPDLISANRDVLLQSVGFTKLVRIEMYCYKVPDLISARDVLLQSAGVRIVLLQSVGFISEILRL